MIRITTTPPLEEKSSLDYKNLPTAQIYHNLYPSCSIDTHSSNLSTKFSSLIQYLRKPARSLQEAYWIMRGAPESIKIGYHIYLHV